MKRNLIFLCAFAAFAMVLSGCGGGGIEAEKINAKEYGNADELGDLAKRHELAQVNGDYDAMWDMMSKERHETYEKMLEELNKDDAKEKRNKEFDALIKTLEKKIEDEEDEKKKGFLQRAVEWNKDMKGKLDNIETAKELYVFANQGNIGSRIVVGEKTEDGKGSLEMMNMSTGTFYFESEKFVKEDDVWKIK